MSRIVINAGGRYVEIEHDRTDLEPLKAAALDLWQQTAEPDRPGPAVGFQAERRWTPGVDPVGCGAYGRPPAPVTA